MTDSHVNVTWLALEGQAFSPPKEWQHLQWLEANYPDCFAEIAISRLRLLNKPRLAAFVNQIKERETRQALAKSFLEALERDFPEMAGAIPPPGDD